MTPHELNNAIVKALGLQGQPITKLELTFEVEQMPALKITRLVSPEQGDGLITAIEILQLRSAP